MPNGSLYYLVQDENAGSPETLTTLTQNGQFVVTANLPEFTAAVAVGTDGSVYVGGSTEEGAIPNISATPGAWQNTYSGVGTGFAGKMKPDLSGFEWVTFVSGTGTLSEGSALNLMAAAPDGTLWVSGDTFDYAFPVLAGALQSQPSSGGFSGFLVHLSGDGSKALASTYLAEPMDAMVVDSSGNVIFSGDYTFGSSFQATPGAQYPCPPPGADLPQPINDTFFGKIDAAGQHLLWGTWSGPSVPVGSVAVDTHGNAIAAGNLPGQQPVILIAMTTIPGPPRLEASCIAQSAYPYLPGPLAPGEIFSIFGAGFGPQQGVVAQPSQNKIGTELGGVQVLIEGTPAPLLYVSSAQINAVAPYLLDGRTAAHVQIVTANATSNEVILGVQQALPEIFESRQFLAAILNQNGTVNSATNPAHAGETVAMFVSGVGQTNPPGVDGEIPQAAGGAPVLPITVSLMITASPSLADVTYVGNAPGLVSGVTQVNFRIPQFKNMYDSVAPADVVLSVGATSSYYSPGTTTVMVQ